MIFKESKKLTFKNAKTNYFFGIVAILIDDLAILPASYLLGSLIDYLKDDNFEIRIVLLKSFFMLFFACMSYFGFLTFAFCCFGSGGKIKMYYKERIFNKLLKKTPDFFEKYTGADIISLSENDTKFIHEYFTFGIMTLIDCTVIPFATVIYLSLFISFKLTILSLLPYPLVIFSSRYFGKKIHETTLKSNEKFSYVNREVLENIEAIELVRSFVNEKIRVKKFLNAIKEYFNYVYLNSKFIILSETFSQFLSVISMAIGFIYGIYLISVGEITKGNLISFFTISGMLSWSFVAIGLYFNTYKRATASILRIDKFLNDKSSIEDGDLNVSGFKDLEFFNFSFKYPNEENDILKDINFKLEKGKTLGIVGKSGSGKTTLIKQILRLYNFDCNKVFLNNIPYEKYKLNSLRELFSYVSQENIILSDTIRENILFGEKFESDEKIFDVMKNASIYDEIIKLDKGLDTIVGERGLGLSGGQRQRIAISRALYRNREILVLDDAFSALDANTEFKIINYLKKFRKDKTNIIVSHRISTLSHADLILVLDNGKIIDSGNHKDLVSKDGWYKEQFEYQSIRGENDGK